MEAKDLLELINTYNSRKKELFDHCAELFISKVRNELEEIYNQGNWTRMLDITQLVISITELSKNFQEINYHIHLESPTRFDRPFHEWSGFLTFDEFIKSKKYKNLNLYDFKSIKQIKPFCKALKRKGLEYYVDVYSCIIVVVLNIK